MSSSRRNISAWSGTFVEKSDSAEKGNGAVLGCVGVLPAVDTTGGGNGAANSGVGNDEGGGPAVAAGPLPGTDEAEEGEGGVGRECEEALLLAAAAAAAAAAGEWEGGADGTAEAGIVGGHPGGPAALALLLVVVLPELSVALG